MEKLLKRAARYLRSGFIDEAMEDIKMYERSLLMKSETLIRTRNKISKARRHLCKIAESLENTVN